MGPESHVVCMTLFMSHVHPLDLSLARGATGGDEGGGGGGCPCEGGRGGQEERRGGEREEKEGERQSKGRIFSRISGSLGRPYHLPPLTGSLIPVARCLPCRERLPIST